LTKNSSQLFSIFNAPVLTRSVNLLSDIFILFTLLFYIILIGVGAWGGAIGFALPGFWLQGGNSLLQDN